jgi:hypothetical protein
MILKNGFQETFQHLYSRWQRFIVAQGNYNNNNNNNNNYYYYYYYYYYY